MAMASAIGLVLIVLAALCAPLYAEHVAGTGPAENHLTDRIELNGKKTDVVSLLDIPIGPTWHAKYFLGADENGRDLAVRLLYGMRTSLLIGFSSVLLTMLLAIPLALAAGYIGGRVDSLISRTLEVVWSFPALLLGVLMGTALTLKGANIGPIEIHAGSHLVPIVIIGLVYVPYLTRPLRGQVLSLSQRQFIEAARANGSGRWRVMFSELLPHLWTTIGVLAALLVANAVVLESALSFLGAGVQPPEPSLGTLIAAGINTVRVSSHLLIVPSIALTLIVLCLSGIQDGARKALDRREGLDFEAGTGL
jgi:peptide/nickel transport system permease protein